VSKGQNAFFLDTYAMALFKAGETDTAIGVETKAIALAKAQPKDVDPGTLSEMKGRLETFQKKKSARK